LPVDADFLSLRDFANILGLVALADILEEGDRRLAVPDLARNLLVPAHDFAHPRLDPAEIFGCERLGAREIVIEAGFRRRPKGHLGVRIKFLDRFGHDMGRVVTQNLEAIFGVPSDDRDRGIAVDNGGKVARPVVDPDCNCCPGEPGPDRGCNIGAADRREKLAALAVGQSNDDRHQGRQFVRGLGRHRGVKNIVVTHR
jgi:hypothetical protein